MAKSRGRDGTITRDTLPLDTTRPMAINPLGSTYSPAQAQVVLRTAYLPAPIVRPGNDITPYATPLRRVAQNAPGNNLYKPDKAPQKVTICKDRSIRREVLFALGHGGRNGQKSARFTPNSKVKC